MSYNALYYDKLAIGALQALSDTGYFILTHSQLVTTAFDGLRSAHQPSLQTECEAAILVIYGMAAYGRRL